MEVVDDDDEDAAGGVVARAARRQDETIAPGRRRRQHVVLTPAVDHRQRDDVLLDAVLVDLELTGLEIGDELAAPVADDGIGPHQLDAASKGGRLILHGGVFGPRGHCESDRHEQDGGNAHGHKTYMLTKWLKPSPSRAMAAQHQAIW